MSLAAVQSVQWARITSANGAPSMATYMNAARIGQMPRSLGIEVRMQSLSGLLPAERWLCVALMNIR